MSKLITCVLFVLLCAVTATAQDNKKVTAYFYGQISDASQFGYRSPDGAMIAGGSYRLSDRITILGEYGYEYAEKTFLDNGHTEHGSAGARVYLIPDRLFLQAKASLISHQNDTYTKTVARGNLGIGAHLADFTATLSFFAPADSVIEDPNTVRGTSVTVEYHRQMFGPVYVVTSGQVATASFTQTFDTGGDRIRGQLYSARTGFAVKF